MIDRLHADDEPLPTQAAPTSWTLEETASLLEATLQGVRTPLALLDLRQRSVRCNRAYMELFGLDADDLAERGVAAIAEAGQRLLVDAAQIRYFWENPPDREARDTLHFKDGRTFERLVTPYELGERIVGQVVSYRDITASEHAERALDYHRVLLEQAQRVAQVGSWVVELEGASRLQWTRETQQIFGADDGDAVDALETLHRYIHPDDRQAVQDARQRATEHQEPFDVEHRIVRPDGETRWVHARADVVRDDTGRPVRLIGTVQDITDRRRLEEQLRQAQKLEAVARLAGGVAHDLNNALTSIVGYTELALGALASDHPAQPDVVEIRRAAERAESVTRQLLAFSRKQPLTPRVFSLADAVTDITRMLQRFLGDRIRLVVSLRGDIAPISGDPGQLEQAIINLAANAKDAMPDGGTLQLAVAMAMITAEDGSPHDPIPAGRYVELSVSDSGLGMPPGTVAHIFEPFFTTKEPGKGTGLGLAMVYGTVKQIGGYIAVRSTIDHGTTFYLRFPPAAAAGAPEPLVSARSPAPIPPAEPTILVVEDETPVRNLVLVSIAKRGYRVLSAASGTEALSVLAREPQIDLLLTDANMPGMSGIELVKRVIEQRPTARIIVMSGFTEDLPLLGELEHRISLLNKPFSPQEIRARIDREFGRG